MSDYIYGIKALSEFFGLSTTDLMYVINNNGLPGVRKFKRIARENFPGGGRGIWALRRDLAEEYQRIRSNTPLYDPSTAVEALLNKYQGSGATSIPELIEMGLIDDIDWCQQLNVERAKSNLHAPILMHPDDLLTWLGRSRPNDAPFESTRSIFRPVRARR